MHIFYLLYNIGLSVNYYFYLLDVSRVDWCTVNESIRFEMDFLCVYPIELTL
jgi:hypothetical protein